MSWWKNSASRRASRTIPDATARAALEVRITALLIRASDSSHWWSETWDRSLEDNFAVQDEIAGAVVALPQ